MVAGDVWCIEVAWEKPGNEENSSGKSRSQVTVGLAVVVHVRGAIQKFSNCTDKIM